MIMCSVLDINRQYCMADSYFYSKISKGIVHCDGPINVIRKINSLLLQGYVNHGCGLTTSLCTHQGVALR